MIDGLTLEKNFAPYNYYLILLHYYKIICIIRRRPLHVIKFKRVFHGSEFKFDFECYFSGRRYFKSMDLYARYFII